MLQLLADRFMCDRGRWFDLSTARPVTVRVESVGGRQRQFEWSDRCAALARLRHPLLNPLLDYGFAAAHATFEAYAITPPLAATALSASHAATHAVRFLRAHAVPLDRACADIIVRPTKPGRRSLRPLGIVLQPRRILDVLAEVLEAGSPGPVTLLVAGPPRSGMTTLRQTFARVARLAGYLPVGIEAARRWPQLQQLTSGRHLCVLSGDEASTDRATPASWLARLGVESTRRHLHVSFVRSSDPRPGSLRLEPLGATAMTSMIYVDPDFGPSAREIFEATRVADGWPGQLLAALHAEPFDKSGESPAWTVHETTAPYVSAPAPRHTRGESTRRIATVLARAEARAIALAAAGRHSAAMRLLDRAARLLLARGQGTEAAKCALQLAWIARSRGATDVAQSQIDRARQLTNDAGLHAALSIASGILWTDTGRFLEAEAASRAALAAAATLQRADLACRASLGLARALLWQERTGDALSALEGLRTPDAPISCEALALAARIHIAAEDLAAALGAASQALQRSVGASSPRLVAAAHRSMAMALMVAGDATGALTHVRDGLRAAAAAHLPLATLRFRAVWLTTLVSHGFDDHAAAKLRGSLRKALRCQRLPHGVRHHLESACRMRPESHTFNAHARRYDTGQVVAEFVDAAQRAPDDRAAVIRILELLAERIHSSSTLVIAGVDGERMLAATGRPWRERPVCARRALETGLAIAIDRASQPPEAAEPVKYAGNAIAAIGCRWPAGSVIDATAVSLHLSASALALSTHVQMLLEVREPPPQTMWGDLLGESAGAVALREAVHRAARAPFPVLVEGESGSGKELVARAVHRFSVRRDRRFCAINCAAITDELVEAELFGHARGAFTGAAAERAGLFEEADGGSLFLDEVGELSARAQAKLLRVLQDGEVRRVGENFPRRVDVRLIAATNRRLEAEVAGGRFRADLRFRLDVIRVAVPPLRDRVADIPILAAHFWNDAASRVGSQATLGPEMIAALARYDWPGNVRELQNAIAWIAVHAPRRGRIGASLLPARLAASGPLSTGSFEAAREEFERRFVRAALAQTGGHRARTAEMLGVSRQGLSKMLKRLGIE